MRRSSVLALVLLAGATVGCTHTAPSAVAPAVEQVPASELEARLGAAFGPSPVAVTLLAQERVEVGVADTTVWAQPDSAAARAQAIARWTWAHYAERAGVRAIWAAFGTTAERPAMAAHRGLLIMYSAKQLRALARAGRAP